MLPPSTQANTPMVSFMARLKPTDLGEAQPKGRALKNTLYGTRSLLS